MGFAVKMILLDFYVKQEAHGKNYQVTLPSKMGSKSGVYSNMPIE